MWENSEDLGYFCLPAPPLPQTTMSFPVRSVLKSVCVPWCASFFYSSQLFRRALRSCVRLSPRRVSPPPRRSPLLSRSAWLSSSQKKLKMYACLTFCFVLSYAFNRSKPPVLLMAKNLSVPSLSTSSTGMSSSSMQ